jgi:hypothetical protein
MKKLLLVTAALCSISASAYADETLKVRVITHVTAAANQDVGDAPDHKLTSWQFTGLISLPDGSTGTAHLTGISEYGKGFGSVPVSYYHFTLKDGSELWLRSTGKVDEQNNFGGQLTVIGGKGRYEGAKGDGTWAGQRFGPMSVGSDAVNDLTINLKK